MPGLNALVTAPLNTVAPQFRLMQARLTPFRWFRTFQEVRPEEGIALGAVVLNTARATAPAQSLDGRFVLFLDGEIYDADAERRRLNASGGAVVGGSDADLLLAGWLSKREKFLAQVHGMFAAVM